MDAITGTCLVTMVFVAGLLAGRAWTLEDAKAGKLAWQGITYSYFKTNKHRVRRALYQSK